MAAPTSGFPATSELGNPLVDDTVVMELTASVNWGIETIYYDSYTAINEFFETERDTISHSVYWDSIAGGSGSEDHYFSIYSNGSYGADQLDCSKDWVWNASNPSSGTETTSCGGPSPTTVSDPLPWKSQHCSVFVVTTYPNGDKDTWVRSADSTLKLHTNGVPGSTSQSIFRFNVTADYINNSTWNGYTSNPASSSVSKNLISIQGQSADAATGQIYLKFSDNSTVTITPSVSNSFYTFSAYNIVKHELRIKVNGTTLEQDQSNVTFPAGQKLYFVSNWSPALSTTSEDTFWLPTGSYVNKITDPFGDPSPIYQHDSALNNAATTQGWYYSSSASQLISVSKDVTLSNGQVINGVVGKGYIGLYKPAAQLAVGPAPTPSFHTWYSYFNSKINLGLTGVHPNPNTSMNYTINVPSTYAGKFIITQLCQLDYNILPGWSFTEWKLDGNTDEYSGPYTVQADPTNTGGFQDQPQMNAAAGTPLRVKGNFKDYIRYRPSAGISTDNIYVTLGIVTWSCHGETDSTDAIITNTITGPSNVSASSSFPTWTNEHP
ncbi:MAG TPA: hypothetical protein EYQ50_23625 [Verrucomicrobiales bacterium]|nr:hypothetical protein [Verrucomicrobiales bacterium]